MTQRRVAVTVDSSAGAPPIAPAIRPPSTQQASDPAGFTATEIDLLVRMLVARQVGATAAQLVQARRSDPEIKSVRVHCLHAGREYPLGPRESLPPRYSKQGKPLPEPARSFGRRLELGLVPAGQPLVAEIFAIHAVQAYALLPGASAWVKCEGKPPWRIEFTAAHPGPVKAIVRNVAKPGGVRAQSVTLRVISQVGLDALHFPGFTPTQIGQLVSALDRSGPPETFDPNAFLAVKRQIEPHTQALLHASRTSLAALERACGDLDMPSALLAHSTAPGPEIAAHWPAMLPPWPHLASPGATPVHEPAQPSAATEEVPL